MAHLFLLSGSWFVENLILGRRGYHQSLFIFLKFAGQGRRGKLAMHNTRRSFKFFPHTITNIALLGVEGDIKDESNSGCFLYCLFIFHVLLVWSHIQVKPGPFSYKESLVTSIQD